MPRKPTKKPKKKTLKPAHKTHAVLYTTTFIVGSLIGAFILSGLIKEKPDTVSVETPLEEPEEEITNGFTEENLEFSSFGDTFSGNGWINKENTTLYQDETITAFTFTPKYTWTTLTTEYYEVQPRKNSVSVNDDDSVTFCIKSKCLTQAGLKLYYSLSEHSESKGYLSNPISLPSAVHNLDLENISIGIVGDEWFVGAVVKKIGTYEAQIYSYDGRKFAKIFGEDNTPFISEHPGTIGFGGNNDDWLAIYSAYEGIIYRFNKDEPKEISKFFGLRTMAGGFYPAATKSHANGSTNWYIFSLTENKPKLIKLFENNEGDISGALDLSQNLSLRSYNQAVFESAGPNKLIAKLKSGNGTELKEFTDQGFDKSENADIVSSNINTYQAAVRAATISEADIEEAGTDVNFFLTNDGRNWQPATVGEEIVFTDKDGKFLLWRATFTPDSNPLTSAFLSHINISYKVKFLKPSNQ